MKYIISGPIGALIVLFSIIACGMESCSYYNVAIWHGNVQPTSISKPGEDLTLNFEYADGKRGWTTSSDVLFAYSTGKLPWLWCDVSRSGRATCYPPKQKGGTK